MGEAVKSTTDLYLTNMYRSRGPYETSKAWRAVRPEGLVHNCFRIPLQNVFYSNKLKFVTVMP